MKKVTEDFIQAEFVLRCNRELPQTRKLLFSVPNGGTRNKLEAMKMVSTGMVAGVPDMLLVWDGKVYAFEFKTPTGTLQPVQKTVHDIWRKQNIDVFVCRSSDEAFEIVKKIVS